jgi:hypothetical protein
MWTFSLLIHAFFFGSWLYRDANRLAQHLDVAVAMIVDGFSEEIAMERSGCNFWEKPWYVRIFTKYPPVPTKPLNLKK